MFDWMNPHDKSTPMPSLDLAIKSNQSSIALPAMRSVRSFARIDSWAQLNLMPPPDEIR